MPLPAAHTTDFIFNENAFFYHKKAGKTVGKTALASALAEATKGKTHVYPINEIFQHVPSMPAGMTYSLRVFKEDGPIPFNNTWPAPKEWHEVKIGYVLIYVYQDYVVIFKKYASSMNKFMKKLEPLSYEKMLSLYISQDTIFNKFTMDSLDGSKNAMRSRTYEADNLQESMSTLSASRQVLKFFRANTNNKEHSVSLTTSRINTYKNKQGFTEICNWVRDTIDAIILSNNQDSFLSVFAKVEDYKSQYQNLHPVSLLFFWRTLYDDLDSGEIIPKFFHRAGVDHPLPTDQFLRYIHRMTDMIDTLLTNPAKPGRYTLRSNAKNIGYSIAVLSSGIHVTSHIADHFILGTTNGDITLTDYINDKNIFNVYFHDIQLVYTNKRLFRDTRLIDSTNQFMRVFNPLPGLLTTNSEKGLTWLKVNMTSTSFPLNSVFGVVEQVFNTPAANTYFICDDMGKEWADHIKIEPDRVSFFISKHHSSKCSASDFQDVVGQALKNLGNLTPTLAQLNSKRDIWSRAYVVDGSDSGILRLRSNGTVDDAIAQWQEAMLNPYFRREVNLVVDFISITDLQNYLNSIQRGNIEKEALQMFWLLSSLVSNCKDMDIDVHIYCKN